MEVGFYFSISTFIIIGIITIIFCLKQRVDNIETKIYGQILVITLLGIFLEIGTCIWYRLGVNVN